MTDDIFHEILESIKEAIKEMKDDQKEIKKDIGEIKADVAVHILRTNLLEDELKNQKTDNADSFDKIEKQIKPLEKDNWKMKGAFALLGLIITILGTIALFKH